MMTPRQPDEAAPYLLRALETMPVAFFSLDQDDHITYVNAEVESVLGLSRADLIGRTLEEAFPGLTTGSEEQYRQLVEEGSIAFEEYYGPLGSWFEVHAWLDDGRVNVAFSNIDERRLFAEERQQALEEAERANARLQFLTDLSSLLAGVRSQAQVFERLVQAVVPSLADWCTIVVPRGDQLVRVAARHRVPALNTLAQRLVGTYPHPLDGPAPSIAAYHSAQPVRLSRLASEIGATLDTSIDSNSYGRTLHLLGDGPALIVPVVSRGDVAALLTLVRTAPRPFNDTEVSLAREAAARVAGSLEEARFVETQRQIAGALQVVGLPSELPEHRRLRLAAGYRAASEGGQVGGDWYDAFTLKDGRISLVVGDASGHGLQAASSMAQMRNALRAYAFRGMSPGETLGALSDLVDAQSPDDFATAVCLYLRPESGELTWASAGHPAPIVLGRTGSSYLRGGTCPPIGWPHSPGAHSGLCDKQLTLSRGDRLFLYTDGLVERRDVDVEIGVAQLMIVADETRQQGPEEACETILDEMLGQAHQDDVCLLVADFC